MASPRVSGLHYVPPTVARGTHGARCRRSPFLRQGLFRPEQHRQRRRAHPALLRLARSHRCSLRGIKSPPGHLSSAGTGAARRNRIEQHIIARRPTGALRWPRPEPRRGLGGAGTRRPDPTDCPAARRAGRGHTCRARRWLRALAPRAARPRASARAVVSAFGHHLVPYRLLPRR